MTDSWQLKLDRAEKHFDEFDAAVRAYVETRPYKAEGVHCKKHGDCRYFVLRVNQPKADLAVILGDAVHNVRSALDHIAVALGPKRRQRSASFPIILEDIECRVGAPCGLNKSWHAFHSAVRGMPDEAVAVIKGAQPYHVRDQPDALALHPLRLVQFIDNADKHRRLAVFAGGLDGVETTVLVNGTPQPPQVQPIGLLAEDGTELAHWQYKGTGATMQMKVRGTPAVGVDVRLKDGFLAFDAIRSMVPHIRDGLIRDLEPFVRREGQ